MVNNKAFWKALHSLTHPFSVAAILLLLFNDHWLRHTYPSLLTGKLGDFTWLLFAPFIAALLFAFLIPPKIKHHTKIVGLASIAFIGIWFATVKTIPFFHWLTTETLYAIVGYRGTLRMDLTDLLTLPALLLSWYIWQKSAETKVNLKPVAYVAFGLAMLGTMANSPGQATYKTSIETLCELDNSSIITSTYSGVVSVFLGPLEEVDYGIDNTFMSQNGGLSWEQTEIIENQSRCSSIDEQIAINPNNSNIQYRWIQGINVEKSTDAGASWQQIHNLQELRQDVRRYGNHNATHTYGVHISYISSPLSGIVHSETGNLVLAMSRDGVLVITPDNDSYWASVGEFQLDELNDISLIHDSLELQQYLIPTLWFLILVTTIVIIGSTWLLTKLWIIIGWLNWGILTIYAHSANAPRITENIPSYIGALERWGIFALASLLFIALPMILWALWNLFRYYRSAIVPILVSIVLASGAYMLPLLLWTQGTIPRYYVAAIFSLLLTGCVLWACYTQFKDKLPARYVLPKEKRKPKEV